MKNQKGVLVLAMAMIALMVGNVFGFALHTETTTFKVYGNCSMCKKRIEGALTKNENIVKADWNVETKMLTVVYNPHAISVNDIHKIVADAGHDTDQVKADDATYKELMGCCKYKRRK